MITYEEAGINYFGDGEYDYNGNPVIVVRINAYPSDTRLATVQPDLQLEAVTPLD